MSPTTTKSRIKDIVRRPYRAIEWYFIKRYLDERFGKREYWGDELYKALKKGVEDE